MQVRGKLSKTVKTPDFAILLFFTKKGVRRYSVSSMRPDLKPSHHYTTLLPHIGKSLHILIFYSPIVISNFQSHFEVQTEHFWENKLYHVDQREKTHQNSRAHVYKLNKLEK